MRKLLALAALVGFIGASQAGTYTWTGSTGDGLYFTAGNWLYDGETATTSPGNAPSDDIVIDGSGVVVEYVPGGDWGPTGNITISGGAKLVQTTGNNYANIQGTMTLDGGTYDAGTCSGLTLSGALVIYDGGALVANVALGRGSNSTLVMYGGTVPTFSGNYALANYPNDTYAGGTFTLTGELQPPAGDRTWEGTAWTAKMFAPRGSGTHTWKSGSLTVTTTSYNGYYQNGSQINIPVDSTASFTWPFKASEVYSKTFGSDATLPLFTYAGSIITESEFESLFEVTDDNGSAPCTFKLIPASETMPKFSATSVAIGDDSDEVVVNASFTNAGTPAATVYLAWGTSDLGRNLSSWGANIQEIGTASIDSAISATVTDLPTGQKLYFRVFADTGSEVGVSDPMSLYMRKYDVDGTVNEWLGTVSTSLSEAGNWSLGHVPTDSEIRWFGTDAVNGVEVSGAFTTIATDMFMGGTVTMTGEFHPVTGTTLRGTTFSCKILAPQASGTVLTAKAGTVLVNDSGNNGFWAPGSTYMDVVSGSTTHFIFPTDADTIYSWTFGANKFKYNGNSITAAEFAELFTVEDYTYADGTTTGVEFYLTPVSDAAASFADAGVTASRTRGSVEVTFTANIANAGDPAATVTLYYGTSNGGSTAANWDNSEELGTASSGSALSKTITLEANQRYYFAACAVNAAATVWCAGSPILIFDIPESPVNTWLGTKSTDSRVAANWSLGHVPTATESVAVYDSCADNDLYWYPETASQITGWEQTSYLGSSVFVKFFTTKTDGLEVTGNVVLNSGNWTHEGPSASPTYCLNVKVDGNMTIAAGAWVQAGTAQENNQKFNPRGYTTGPGYLVVTNTTADAVGGTNIVTYTYMGGAYAGDGGHIPYAGPFVSYGSILDPMDWGSAGKGDSVSSYSGPGLIKLVVGGTLTVNGTIESHGFGWDTQSSAASGGTVNIKAGSIAGTGTIDADGGRNFTAPGSGGRIRVELTDSSATFDSFNAPEHIHANPGNFTNLVQPETADAVLGAAGTVVLVTAADGTASSVVVSDTNTNRRDATDTTSLVSATHLPARQNASESLKGSRWQLLNYGKLRLTANAGIAALTIADTAKAKVFLDGYTLTVSSLKVGSRKFSGTYTAAQLNAAIAGEGETVSVFEGEGSVICGGQSQGLVIIFR